jgi:heterodisulfide reductase subunit A2
MELDETLYSETLETPSPISIGVVVCDCGGKISELIDTQALCQCASMLPDVVYTAHEAFPCSKDGRQRILKSIKEHGLNRLLIAGCSPRLVRDLFRRTGQSMGLARSFVNIANIREQCVYPHSVEKNLAFNKAADLIEMGVTRLTVVSAEHPRIGRVVKSALIIGSDLSGLTVALALAEKGFQVILVERSSGFGTTLTDDLLKRTRQQTIEKGQAVENHLLIRTLFDARITEVTGHPGDYLVRVQQNDQSLTYPVGAIVVANAAQPKKLDETQWFDHNKVKTQAEFEAELEEASRDNNQLNLDNVVMILCAEETQRERCSRVCCNIGIRQAILTKQLNPEAKVTVLFRELYLGGLEEDYQNQLIRAREMGVTFFRYRQNRPPVISSQSIDILDTLTNEPLRVPYDRAVLSMPLVPQDNTATLAALLGLPLDEDGFLAEPRVRLRPGRYAEPGIYALGSAQQPADTAESLFQAYLTSSRVMRFLAQDTIKVETPAAKIEPALCTGCGNCPQVCPTSAIRLEKQDGILSCSEVDELRCIGCGNCVVVCPSKAIRLPGWDDTEIPIQISAALHSRSVKNAEGKIVVLACEWSAYAAADLAGVRHLTYPANVRIIRTNCSARFDPYHILWAFLNGADGVFLGACPPGECHYGAGNLFAEERVEALKKELAEHNFDPRRLHLEFFSVDDGKKFAASLTDFVNQVHELNQ